MTPPPGPTVKLLAISGSARAASTNTALLRAVRDIAPDRFEITLYDRVGALPVFSPDLENDPPAPVRDLIAAIARADGLIVASPEYVHAIPGGLKNAIDWLVSREAIVSKPVALLHGSHRGEDMLASLRLVLATVTDRFAAHIFLRIPVLSLSPDAVRETVTAPERRRAVAGFLDELAAWVGEP